ncbi:hypothetical protein [Deinococcus ruber]|uniref:Uncharacterized protein n=1 Tax=Deinococcus ruber TaxID=1848197 RepID=A0A918C790_9DEIO|nr:hypothetical protein [Deinococcus ruber]GGR07208.1 hypothetical protein GCM10008957_19830 [Deinococcus ruber]
MMANEPAPDTTEHAPEHALPRTFVTLKELAPLPLAEQSDEDVMAWVMEQLQADKKTLDLLATL